MTHSNPRSLRSHKAGNKIKADKVLGSCDVYPEYILHDGTEALRRRLHSCLGEQSYPTGMAASPLENWRRLPGDFSCYSCYRVLT